ncbi:hypothetical protein ABPG72_002828 [Tetrahymena utriculariae]
MSAECVKVMVRCRPMNKDEKSKNCQSCIGIDKEINQITLSKPGESDKQKVHTYDDVFAPDSTQQQIYESTAFPLVESVFEGYNGTIFAYGQTGCGKTHTMMGDPSDDQNKGIIPRTFSHIIQVIENESKKEFLVRCSYIEIYNEEIHDLLSKDVKARYELKESPEKGIFIKDLNKVIVKSVKEMENLMNIGNKNRSTGETAMNKDSSRSHSIFTIYIEISEDDGKGGQKIKAGKLNLVDLAGSERQSKTQATGDRLKEANKINLSLSALGNVIQALVDGKHQHIPYRDSKLTRLLQDSLGGNTKTIMIAAISPADYNYDETMGTLRYASRAKNIQNKPKINEDPKDALLREYAEEINRLKNMLQNNSGKQGDLNYEQTRNMSENHKKIHIEEIEKLKEAHSALNKDKEKMELELKEQQEKVKEEMEQRLKMQQLLEEFQKNKMVGGNGGDEKQKKVYQDLKKKLKKQQKEHEKLIQDNKKKEEEMLEAEKNYQNLQEEVEAQRKIIKKLKNKYKQSSQEIEDLEREHREEKEEILESVRILEKENKLLNSVIDMVFKKEEFENIRNLSQWNDTKNCYVVPPFYFKNKELRLPKLPATQAMEQVEVEKDSRILQIENKNEIKVTKNRKVREKSSIVEDHSLENSPNQAKKPKKNTSNIEQDLRGRQQQQLLQSKKSLMDMTNNYLQSKEQRFGTGNYGGYSFKEELQPLAPPKVIKKNINGIQLNPLQTNPNTNNILEIIEKQNTTPNQNEIKRNPKTQPLLPLNFTQQSSKSVESRY